MGGLETLLISMSRAMVRVHVEGRLGVSCTTYHPITRVGQAEVHAVHLRSRDGVRCPLTGQTPDASDMGSKCDISLCVFVPHVVPVAPCPGCSLQPCYGYDADRSVLTTAPVLQAIEHFVEGKSVVVCAPTGAGKTVIAEAAAAAALARGQRVIYTTPLKVGAVFGKAGRVQGGCTMTVLVLLPRPVWDAH